MQAVRHTPWSNLKGIQSCTAHPATNDVPTFVREGHHDPRSGEQNDEKSDASRQWDYQQGSKNLIWKNVSLIVWFNLIIHFRKYSAGRVSTNDAR